MDTNPRMPAAGLTHAGRDESAAYCVQPDLDRTQPAGDSYGPPSQHRWRQSFRREVGTRFVHAGLVGAPLPPPEYRHGIRTSSGDKAGDCLVTPGPESELGAFLAEQRERVYRSSVREPLGSGFVRGHNLPQKVHDPSFRFGVSTSESESAKNLIYMPTAAPLHRSHGSVDAGGLNQSAEEYARTLQNVTTSAAATQYQSMASTASAAGAGSRAGSAGAGGAERHYAEREVTRPLSREYDWRSAGIDPSTHRFGKVVNANPATSFQTGLAGVLKHSEEEMSRTRIGSKRVEEAKSAAWDHLGKGRRQRGALAGDIDDPASGASGELLNQTGHRSRTFGRPGAHDEWGARDCIRGTYTEAEQLPDPDVGVSKWRVTKLEHLPPNHADRSFGLPSVRADRRPPRQRSLACDMNFGDESNGKGLLYPSPYACEGVNEEDFLREREPAHIRAVFVTLGLQFADEQFALLCSLARQRYGALSVDSFRHAWNQVRLGLVCVECGASLCQHEDCARQACRHNERANHAPNARHAKQEPPREVQPAGFTNLPRMTH